MVDERGVEVHDQALRGRHARRFLKFLGADRELVIGLERVDEVYSLWQHFAGDLAEESQNADGAGIHSGDGGEYKNHQQKADEPQSQQAQDAAALHVDHFAPRRIENCHGTSLSFEL